MIVLASAREMEYPPHVGLLSIKCVVRGEEWYEISGGPALRVDPSRYLLLNQGQTFTSWFRSSEPVESFCIFFEPALAEDAARCLAATEDQLVSDPENPKEPPCFFERLYRHTPLVSVQLRRIRDRVQRGDAQTDWLEEQLHFLLEHVIARHIQASGAAQGLSAKRPSTRLELYRRLHRARGFIDSCFERPIGLDEIARASFLSKHHFLRSFSQLFRVTPRQYLIERRLAAARRHLLEPHLSITEIAVEVGFESPTYFSNLFRQRVGLTPQQFRQRKASGAVEPWLLSS